MLQSLTNYFQYNIQGLINFGAGSLSLSVGLLVLLNDFKSKLHRSFFLISLTGSIWLLTYSMIYMVQDTAHAYFWLGVGYLTGVSFISPSVYLFSVRWTHQRIKPWLIPFSYITGLILGLTMFLFTEEICGFRPHSWGRLNSYGETLFSRIYLVFFITHFFSFASMAFWYIFQAWRKAASPNDKIQY
ncbi:hypothetical protein BVX98_03270, partial [bacterium F11]